MFKNWYMKPLKRIRKSLIKLIFKGKFKEVDEHRRHVNQGNDQIGTINARLVEMGQN
jgi:hypothetical protein